MIISAIKTNLIQKYQNNTQQKQNFVMTKCMAKDAFQYTNAGMQQTFRGGLSFKDLSKRIIKSLNEDITAAKEKEPHKLPELYLQKAEVEARSGKKEKALESLRELSKIIYGNLKNNSKDNLVNSLKILKRKAALEGAMEFKKNAIRTLKTIVKLEPKDKNNHLKLINKQMEYGYNNDAHKSFENVVNQFPNDINILRDKSYFEENENKPLKAIDTLKKMIEINPKEVEFYYRKASLENSSKNLTAVMETLGEGIKANPNETNFYNYKVGLEIILKNFPAAMKTLNDGIKANPHETEFYLKKANLEIDLKKIPEAIKTFDDGIKENPHETELYLKKASLEVNLKKIPEAIKTLNDGIKANPNEGILYNNRGGYHILQNNLDKAEEDFNTALKKDPDDDLRSIIFFNKSQIYKLKGDEETSMSLIEKSLEINPKNDTAMKKFYEKVITNIHESKFEEASEILKKIVKLNPEDITMHFVKVHLNAFTGDFKEALEGFKPLVKKYSSNPVILAYSAAIHSHVDDATGDNFEEARRNLTKAQCYLKVMKNQGASEDSDVFIIVNNLSKLVEKKFHGENVKFPISIEVLKNPDYDPSIKFDWEEPDSPVKPDWE